MLRILSGSTALPTSQFLGARGLGERRMRVHVLMSAAAMASLAAMPVYAQDATWLPVTASGDFNTAANWTPATVPTGTAFFGTSNTTALSFSRPTPRSAAGPSTPGPRPIRSSTLSRSSSMALASSLTAAAPPSTTPASAAPEFLSAHSTAGSATITNSSATCISTTPARPAAPPSPTTPSAPAFQQHQHGRQRHHHQHRHYAFFFDTQHGRQRHHHQQRLGSLCLQ